MIERNEKNIFWNYSLTLYQDTEIASLSLRLQDQFGLNVNCLLYAVWLASEGKLLSEQGWLKANTVISDFEQKVTVPLRDIRREVKSIGEESIYRQFKDLELACERLVQDKLYQFSQSWPFTVQEPTLAIASLNIMTYAGREVSHKLKADLEKFVSLCWTVTSKN